MAIGDVGRSTGRISERYGGATYGLPGAADATRNGGDGSDGRRLARALGWFSIGLGVAEIVAPRQLARMIGTPPRTGVLRALGAREIASGVGILSRPRSAGWMWSRVLGDAMDLALLGAARRMCGADRERLTAATAAVAGVTALDVLSSRRLGREEGAAPRRGAGGVVEVRQSIAVNRTPEECYRYWRDFQNLPCIMQHLESVQPTGPNQSRWVAKAPAGVRVEWIAEIVDDRADELIAWTSIADADVKNAGSVRFETAPGGRGTYVTVGIRYEPPGGQLGALVIKLLGQDPEQQVKQDLRRFKQIMETGEITTNEGTPAGRRSVLAQLKRGSK
jgi:uncharacterized membrane protein